MPSNMKLFEVRVRVWDDYIVEVDAEDEFKAVQFVEDNINEVEYIGYNSDGGRDIDDDVTLLGECANEDEDEDEDEDEEDE